MCVCMLVRCGRSDAMVVLVFLCEWQRAAIAPGWDQGANEHFSKWTGGGKEERMMEGDGEEVMVLRTPFTVY